MSPELLPGQLAPTVAEGGPGPPPMPKLRRAERSPDPRRWSFVVPPVLAEAIVDSDAFKNHRALVERVEAAAAKLAELRAAHEQALAKDRQAEQAFASKGGRKLPRPTAPAAAEAVEQAERELDLLERQLPKSADALFAEAYPHLEAAAARLERQAHDDDERVEAAILAALAALDERAELDRHPLLKHSADPVKPGGLSRHFGSRRSCRSTRGRARRRTARSRPSCAGRCRSWRTSASSGGGGVTSGASRSRCTFTRIARRGRPTVGRSPRVAPRPSGPCAKLSRPDDDRAAPAGRGHRPTPGVDGGGARPRRASLPRARA